MNFISSAFSLLVFGFLAGFTFAQPRCDTLDISSFTGQCISFNSDSVAVEIQSYEDGKPSGLWKQLNAKGDVIGARYFPIEGDSLLAENQPADSNNVELKLASFPGGDVAMKRYFGANKKYPAEAKKNCLQGVVYTSFLVDTVGQISEINIERGIDSATLDAEAIRLIENMPDWIPGQEGEEKFTMRIKIPVLFRLPECN